jgi:hypothetical protein
MAYTSEKTPSTKTAPPPVATLHDGLRFVKIWERATDNGSFYNVTIERRYKNKDEEWASTRSLNQDDLLAVAELLTQAYKEIKRLRRPLTEQA